MTLQELLNTDSSALGEWLRQGLTWWVAELADLVPAGWRRRGGGDRSVAQFVADDRAVRIWRAGRFVERREGDKARPSAADLGLPKAAVLQRELMLPALGLSDLRRLVANDLDRLTPFRPDQVYFDLELVDQAPVGGKRAVRLGVIDRAEAEAALDLARRCGVDPRRLGLLTEDDGLRFDFLVGVRAAGRGGRPDRAALYWWAAAAAMVAVNLGVLVFKDMDDLATLRRTLDLQRPTVALALKLRQRVETDADGRKALLARRSHNEPLRIIDAATRAFPAPQWIQRLEWNGRLVRLVGYRDTGFDVLAAARASTVLARPRTISSNDPPAPGARPGFDLVAEPVPEARR